MLKVKKGVRIKGIETEALLALLTAQTVYAEKGEEAVVTSVTDGMHMAGSLHHSGHAFDLRTRHLDAETATTIHREIERRLPEYDAVLESDHLHIEYDPG